MKLEEVQQRRRMLEEDYRMRRTTLDDVITATPPQPYEAKLEAMVAYRSGDEATLQATTASAKTYTEELLEAGATPSQVFDAIERIDTDETAKTYALAYGQILDEYEQEECVRRCSAADLVPGDSEVAQKAKLVIARMAAIAHRDSVLEGIVDELHGDVAEEDIAEALQVYDLEKDEPYLEADGAALIESRYHSYRAAMRQIYAGTYTVLSGTALEAATDRLRAGSPTALVGSRIAVKDLVSIRRAADRQYSADLAVGAALLDEAEQVFGGGDSGDGPGRAQALGACLAKAEAALGFAAAPPGPEALAALPHAQALHDLFAARGSLGACEARRKYVYDQIRANLASQ